MERPQNEKGEGYDLPQPLELDRHGIFAVCLTDPRPQHSVYMTRLDADHRQDAGQLAKRERCTMRQINLTLSLAFLAPQLVKAAVEGRLPRGINIERLRDPDAEWSKQFQDLGLNPN